MAKLYTKEEVLAELSKRKRKTNLYDGVAKLCEIDNETCIWNQSREILSTSGNLLVYLSSKPRVIAVQTPYVFGMLTLCDKEPQFREINGNANVDTSDTYDTVRSHCFLTTDDFYLGKLFTIAPKIAHELPEPYRSRLLAYLLKNEQRTEKQFLVEIPRPPAEVERMKKAVRGRESYRSWGRLIKFLNKKPKPVDILKKFHDELDDRHGYGSATNAHYSLESLKLALKDAKVKSKCRTK